MLTLGIVLIIVGAVLVLIGRRNGEPFLFYGGVIVFAGGVLFFLLAVLDVSGASTHAMIGGAVAMAVVPPLSHNDPAVPVAGSVTDRQPVLVAFIVGAVPLILAAITALADLFAAVPDWIVPTLTVIGTLTVGLAALWARVRVTPTAMPRLDDRTPLVPMIESEAT